MAMDIIARATAAAARTDASQALGRLVPAGLFNELASRTIDPAINTLTTTGYSVRGTGGATYVSDSLADAALAAAHPRFCSQTANARYFRLSGDSITVEQGGATGTGNDQPAVYAAVAYANAVGIREVRFTRTAYELWTPLRSAPNATYGTAGGGYPIYVTDSIALVGPAGGTTLTLKNSVGGSKNAITQSPGGSPWQGGGIYIDPNPSTTQYMDFFHAENLTVDGGVTYNPSDRSNTNLSDKGIAVFHGIGRYTIRNCEFRNFAGEIVYTGGNSVQFMLTENLKTHGSPQSAFNPGASRKSLHVNLESGRSYQPTETVGMQGMTYIGGRFYDGYGCTFMGGPDPDYVGGWAYNYPFRRSDISPPWITFIGTRFENLTQVGLGSFVRGNIVTVDTTCFVGGYMDASDVHLDIEAWCDLRTNFEAAALQGPQNLTTQLANCPAGNFQKPPKNIRVNVTCRRSALAVTNGRYHVNGVRLYAGLYDKATCHFVVSGEALYAYQVLNTPPANFAIPLIEFENFRAVNTPWGGFNDTLSADKTYTIDLASYSLNPSAATNYNISVSSTYGYADGQLFTFYHNSASAGTFTFAATGAGMKLPATRKLSVRGDRLVLRYDSRLGTWLEELFESAQQLTLAGSATYDAPSIAAAGTTTTTVAVAGAVLGDYVERIALGVPLAGLVVTGYVSAANTVTVVLFNPTAAAVDLAGTTLSVEVRKK